MRTRAKSGHHEAHEDHEEKPDKCDEGFETPADLAGPASPGRGVRETRDRQDAGEVVVRLVGRASPSHRLAAAGGRQVSASLRVLRELRGSRS